jgi:WYL domain
LSVRLEIILIALFLAERMMHQFRGTPYTGHSHLRADIRMFAVQSVLPLRDSGGTFDRPVDFRVDKYLKGSFRTVRGDGDYVVVLRFGRDVARRYAEKRSHTNQVLEPQAHPTPIARMHIVVSKFASPGTRVQFPPPPLFLNRRQQATTRVMTRLTFQIAHELRQTTIGPYSAKRRQ